MSYSRKNAKNRRKRIKFIESQIQDIENKLHTEINMRYKRELEKKQMAIINGNMRVHM